MTSYPIIFRSLSAAFVGGALVLAAGSARAQTAKPKAAPAAAAPAPAPGAKPHVLVVDLERAVYETEDGLRVEAILRRIGDLRDTEMDKQARKLDAEQNQLRNDMAGGKMSQRDAQGRVESLQKRYVELQSMRASSDDEMARRREQLARPIFDKIRRLVAKMAQDHENAVVVDRSGSPALPNGCVAFVRDELEITDRVIRMYNADPVHSASVPPKK